MSRTTFNPNLVHNWKPTFDTAICPDCGTQWITALTRFDWNPHTASVEECPAKTSYRNAGLNPSGKKVVEMIKQFQVEAGLKHE